jgi:hypothetical protein
MVLGQDGFSSADESQNSECHLHVLEFWWMIEASSIMNKMCIFNLQTDEESCKNWGSLTRIDQNWASVHPWPIAKAPNEFMEQTWGETKYLVLSSAAAANSPSLMRKTYYNLHMLVSNMNLLVQLCCLFWDRTKYNNNCRNSMIRDRQKTEK